ncbi:XRE family transcriptional regulator [Clostridium sp. D2Q-11]|uniref:XRE family transcriptional regulator n=1 Tax=Anaeromonas frigoriresistens TaxID=2683708 RepID=A0A942UTA8_9FIRM|nr:XRE family transcriptional regulator [Anaeromonas frigoriresistens]MBS4538183.1 XRE family transcriptional regulator [Anaeromonas frigoriresistens]
MYKNLEAELARFNLTKGDIAKDLELSYGTIINKFKGKQDFTLGEAFIIKNKRFSNLTIEYLFERSEE